MGQANAFECENCRRVAIAGDVPSGWISFSAYNDTICFEEVRDGGSFTDCQSRFDFCDDKCFCRWLEQQRSS